MASKKKPGAGNAPPKKTLPAKRNKRPAKKPAKTSKIKSLKSPSKPKQKPKAKAAKFALKEPRKPATKRRPVAGPAGPRPAPKRPAAKRIAAKKPQVKRPGTASAVAPKATLNTPVARKTAPRSQSARRAQPSSPPRSPAAARPVLKAPLVRPPAPTTTVTTPKPAPSPKPVSKAAAPATAPAPAKPATPTFPPARPLPPQTGQAQPGQPQPVQARPIAPRPAIPPKPAAPAAPAAPKTGHKVLGKMRPGYETILTTQAVDFIVGLERRFRADYKRLLQAREDRQRRLDAGEKPDFLPETVNIRNGDWTVAPLPRDLHDRRVEITGPTDRKMVINALNSGASCYMADFEDANSPTWANQVEGQINLRDAVAGTISYKDPANGKDYRLNPQRAVLIVRPRGWHLPERHLVVDGEPISGALFDFGLFFFHNARPMIRGGTGPYVYLPKLETHLEARLWNDVFLHAQRAFGLPRGTIKATILIETITAAFEMDEILYELRDHAAGLNAGRWDYIFSFIKKLRNDRSKVLPDRAKVTMASPFLKAYAQLLVKTCHKREVHAMGGMAAEIPIKDDAHANQAALDKVRQDKEREAAEGHDGTWVAHPALVPLAKAVFDKVMPHPNQNARKRNDVQVTAQDLLAVPPGPKTEAGLRQNVAVGIGYIEAWLGGQGCVPLFNLMEDAATAEISRTQVWQWIRHHSKLDDGRLVTPALCRQVIVEEVAKFRKARKPGTPDKFDQAAELFRKLIEAPDCADFLTLPAYDMLAD